MQRSRPFARARRTFGCMEPLEELRAKIAEFPGYDGDIERRRSDEYVRSYLGESLANLAPRGAVPVELRQRVDDLVLRVGFANPADFGARRSVAAANEAHDVSALAAADAATVELADRAASIEPAALGPYLDEVAVTLDRRDAALRAASMS